MTIDEMLEEAQKGSGGSLNTANYFALAGDTSTGEQFVLNLEDFLTDNFGHFLQNEVTSIVLLGAYHTEQSARNSMQSVFDDYKLNPEGLIWVKDYHVLIADVNANHLYTLSLMDCYIGCMVFYQYKAEAGKGSVVLNIFSNKEAAEETKEIIRMYIKDEGGDLL
ncbi:hypothetical protein F0919_00310 [Taibaiella lutea]|uniref:Uncharacterized protein n=1 Tax=Taibaiella lutea TaxID=2608001 RepID=A0A5M6CSM6_9BACT|nr:hypothetical protein [Taibaiella lutea]KAA5536149.1 hypothetical protein F0919_00310 [Taibaiella lutea]